MTSEEFQLGITTLFCQGFEKKIRLIFKLYDVGQKGKISKENATLILNHVPIISDSYEEEKKEEEDGSAKWTNVTDLKRKEN